MSNRQERKARKAAGIPLETEPKRPTTPYLTKQERYEKRRGERIKAERQQATMNRIAANASRMLDTETKL